MALSTYGPHPARPPSAPGTATDPPFLESVRIVCRPAIAAGFALSGLRTDDADDAAAARARIDALAADPDVGIVLVDETLHRALPADWLQRLEREARPVVVAFPGPRFVEGALAEEALLDILRRAIGYRVRLP